MPRFQDFLRDPCLEAIRVKIGEGVRDQYNLMEPVPQSLVALLRRLETSAGARETKRAKLFAELDECVGEMVRAAGRTPRDP
jgi:hypothetical protein